MEKIRVTIWNEFVHERENPDIARIYPKGIHDVLAQALRKANPNFEIRTSTLREPEQGLSEQTLGATDVLVYWAHAAHDEVREETVLRLQKRVLDGMGFVPLHSA